MTTQQPPEPSSHDAHYRVIRHMLHITAFLRKQELQQGVVIRGPSGVGKSIAVEVFLTTKDKKGK